MSVYRPAAALALEQRFEGRLPEALNAERSLDSIDGKARVLQERVAFFGNLGGAGAPAVRACQVERPVIPKGHSSSMGVANGSAKPDEGTAGLSLLQA